MGDPMDSIKRLRDEAQAMADEITKEMTCRTCKFLDVALDSAGRRMPRKDRLYQCTVPVLQPVLPACITVNPRFTWPPPRTCMEPDSGTGCPFWDGNRL